MFVSFKNNDIPSLLGRSQARSKVTQYKGALEDVARATGQFLHFVRPQKYTTRQIHYCLRKQFVLDLAIQYFI